MPHIGKWKREPSANEARAEPPALGFCTATCGPTPSHAVSPLSAKTEHTVVEVVETKSASRVGEKGKGTELADMPRVCELLSKHESKSRELKVLHRCDPSATPSPASLHSVLHLRRVLFGVDGKESMRKRQIRAFSGDLHSPAAVGVFLPFIRSLTPGITGITAEAANEKVRATPPRAKPTPPA